MPTIQVKQDIRRDAWNWWAACNSVGFGVDWKKRVGSDTVERLEKKTRKEAFQFLIPHLKEIYKKQQINKKIDSIQKVLDGRNSLIFSIMEEVTKKKIYRNNFVCFATTFPRGPYDYENGYIWMPIMWPKKSYVTTFIHELLHFQTLRYWRKECLEKISVEDFENLKEALTVILNVEFEGIIEEKDFGYKMHEKLREKLLAFWLENKNFDGLVKYGTALFEKKEAEL